MSLLLGSVASTLSGIFSDERRFDQTLNLIGNVTRRAGVGNFTCHASNKYAVIAAGTVSYGDAAAGQMTSRAGKPITWKSSASR